jgi:hypothetical protein
MANTEMTQHERERSNAYHNGHEHGTYPVCQPLHGGFFLLGFLDHANDACQHGGATCGGKADDGIAVSHDCASDNGIASCPADVCAFARYHALVHVQFARFDHSISRDAVSGIQAHSVSHRQLPEGYLSGFPGPIFQYLFLGDAHLEVAKVADGRGGLLHSAMFYHIAEQHQAI